MNETVASLVEYAMVFSIDEMGNTIHKHFENELSSNGVVIMDERKKPIGLIMRSHFYQMIGTQFGYSVYMNRPIDLLMKKDILCLDINHDLGQFGLKAMSRQDNDIYDYVIILKNNRYHGIVSISRFLATMSELKQREIELLNNQQKILEQAHEKEKSLRQEIEIRNNSIQKLLDNADQGFLSFQDDLKIYEEHSAICKTIFGQEIADEHFGNLMQQFLDQKQHRLLVDTLASLFNQKSKARAKIFIKLLPSEFEVNSRYINISYKLISFSPVKILMVILTDITDRKALERKSQEEKNNMKLVLSAINNKTEILEAVDEAKLFFSHEASQILKGNNVAEVLNTLFRTIHTMKGDFALRLMHNSAIHLHMLEDKLSAMLKSTNEISISYLEEFLHSIDMEKIIEEDYKIIKGFLGDNFFESDKNININHDRLEELIKAIEDRFSGDDKSFLVNTIQELTYPSLNSILSSYSEYIQILALKLDKNISEFNVTGDTISINRQQYSNFLKSMIHIFRNIVDHGIEPPEERIEKGKNESGKIRCGIYKNHENFVLEISDDGQGIDPEKILTIAKEKDLYTQEQIVKLNQSDVINTIFLDSFSTKEGVSLLSGRGVGLAAVRNEVEALDGSIEAISAINEGTLFKITLPLQ